MGIFRKSPVGEPLAVAMAGLKLGDRFLAIGIRDTKLIAALAIKAGLTGRACAVDADPARTGTAAAAIEREGGLAEVAQAPWHALPYEAASFDVAVARDLFSTLDPDEKHRCAAEALRVLRPGGRIIVIERTKRTRIDPDALTMSIGKAGFAAARVLAQTEGMMFVEGIKKA